MIKCKQYKGDLMISYLDAEGDQKILRYHLKESDCARWVETSTRGVSSKQNQHGIWCDKSDKSKSFLTDLQKQEFIQFLPQQQKDKIFGVPGKIKTFYWDIETESTDGTFPSAEKAKGRIFTHAYCDSDYNCVAMGTQELTQEQVQEIQDLINQHVSSLKNKKQYTFRYDKFPDEESMNREFINRAKLMPMISGWNMVKYDIQYLMNRCEHTGVDYAAMSPTHTTSPLKIMDKFDKDSYTIVHIPDHKAVIDYMALVRDIDKSIKHKQSHNLDHIAELTLGIKKIKYNGSLQKLYYDDFKKFIFYNIIDCVLVQKIEEKHGLVGLLIQLSNMGKIDLQDAFYASKIVKGLLMDRYWQDGKIITSSDEYSNNDDTYEGAFVMPPVLGMHKRVSIYDFASLFPSLISAFNISPDTYLGQRENICQHFDPETMIVTASGAVYTNTYDGYTRKIINDLISLRLDAKAKTSYYTKLLHENDTEENRRMLAHYKNINQVIKIVLNSIYGVLGYTKFLFYKREIAESITAESVQMIKATADFFNDYFTNQFRSTSWFNVTGKINKNIVLYGDTDSVFIDFDHIISCTDYKGDFVDFIERYNDEILTQAIRDFLDSYITSRKAIHKRPDGKHCMDLTYEQSLHSILISSKKKYAKNIASSDGVRYENLQEIEIKGLESNKSSVPKYIREKLKDMIHNLLAGTTENKITDEIRKFKKEFKYANIEDITTVQNIKNYGKYVNEDGFEKGIPIHIRASYYYNKQLAELPPDVRVKYDYIRSGDKVRMYYSTNSHGVFAFNATDVPHELISQNKVDYDVQFEKQFLDPYNRLHKLVFRREIPADFDMPSLF